MADAATAARPNLVEKKPASPRKRGTPEPAPVSMIPKVRQPDFEFPEDLPRYWWDNDPAKTLLLAALSSGFPPGERFSIDSVRHYPDESTDRELKKSVGGCIGQEAQGSKERGELTEFREARGMGGARLERDVRGFPGGMQKSLAPERQRAYGVAVEHFTTRMAEEFL